MTQIPLYYYIAFNNPDGAKSVIEDFGYEIYGVNNRSDLAQCVKQLIQEKGAAAVEALAKVHPDRRLIIDTSGETRALGADGDTALLPAPASTVAAAVAPKQANDYTMVMIAGMFLSALAITAMIIVKK